MPGMLPGMDAANAIDTQPAVYERARLIDTIVMHCSATASGRWLRGAAGAPGHVPAAKVIDEMHAARGFLRSDPIAKTFNPGLPHIGYHFVIDLGGDVQTGRGLREVGAHVAGFNARSVGICMVGGIERDARFTAPQWAAAGMLVRMLCKRLNLLPMLPLYPQHGGGVCGHRDMSPDANKDGRITSVDWLKTCPGFDVGAWLSRGMQPLPEQICEVPK